MKMGKLIYQIIIFFILLQNSCNSFENKILLKINNEIITYVDVLNEIKYLSLLNPKINDMDNKIIFQLSKESIIREKVKKLEILENKKKENLNNIEIKLEDKKLNVFIEQTFKNLGFENFEQFENYVNQNSFDIELLKEKISIEILWNELIYKKFKDKIQINEEEIDRELTNIKEDENLLLLYEIQLELESDIETKFNSIKESITKDGFENAASIYSTAFSSKLGGKIGWINKYSLNKSIKEKVLKLNVGEFTDPIQIQSGFIILYLKNKKSNMEELDLNKKRLEIINLKINEQLNQFSNIYYNKIKKNTKVNEI